MSAAVNDQGTASSGVESETREDADSVVSTSDLPSTLDADASIGTVSGKAEPTSSDPLIDSADHEINQSAVSGPTSPTSPTSRIKLNDSLQADGLHEEVQASGCCFWRKRKTKQSPIQDNTESTNPLSDDNGAKKKNPKSKKKKNAAKKDQGAKKKMRRQTISVEALSDGKKIVELDEDEMAVVKEAHEKVDGIFSVAELNGLYADYKMNGKEITQTDFHIIFSTLTRSGDASQADLVFAMFDSDNSGTLGFLKFVEAVAIMARGTPDKKMELCFNMIDRNKDGELDHGELVGILKYLPMKRMKKQQDALNRLSMGSSVILGEPEKLDELREVDEDGDDEADFDDSARPRFGSTRGAGQASTLMRRRAHDSENEKIAMLVVDEAFKALDKPPTESLSLDEFKSLSAMPEIAEYFMPFVFEN